MKLLKIYIALAIMLFCANFTQAQNGKYRVKLQVRCFDLNTDKLHVDIFVRARNSSSTFRLADQNYRFKFNPLALANPTLNPNNGLVGLEESYDGTYSFFDAHTLEGSNDNTISYNIPFAGGAGYLLQHNLWTVAARLTFDILDFNEDTGLEWLKQNHFPPTVIIEKFGNTDFADVLGTTYTYYTKCYDNYTPPSARIIQNENSTVENEVFPNPFTNEIQINLNCEQDGDKLIKVFDNQGKKVYTNEVKLHKGQNNLSIDLSHLVTGIYLLQVVQENDVFTRKIHKL